MQKNRFSYMARRDFLKLSAMACASLSLTACASLPASSVQTCSLPGECLLLDDKKEIRLTNCNLVDIKTGKIIERAVVRMKDGLVIEAGKPMGELPPGAEVLNLNGRYIVPGLINAHLHMTLTPVSSFRWGMIFRALPLIKAAYTQSIASGITTVRDMAALPPILHHYQHAMDRGSLVGPRVVHSNNWLGVKDGYMDLDPGDVTWFLGLVMAAVGPMKIDITEVSKQENLLRENCAEATYIKLASMDNRSLIAGKRDLDLPTFSDRQLSDLFDFAAKVEHPVAAHIMTAYGFRRVMKYPIKYLEHVVSDTILEEAEINAIADRHINVIPTMVLGNLYAFDFAFEMLPAEFRNDFIENEIKIRKAYWDSLNDDKELAVAHAANNDALGYFKKEHYDWKAMAKKHEFAPNPIPFLEMLTKGRENLMRMKDAGVAIGCGTDSGVPMNYHGTLWREMEMLSRLGWSNLEVLQAATLVNARICHMEDRIGSLERGKYADVVVLENNPLTTITAYRKPSLVFKEGKLLVQRCEIKHQKEPEGALCIRDRKEQMADIALKSMGDGAMFYNPEEMNEADCTLVLKHAFEGIPLDNKLVCKG